MFKKLCFGGLVSLFVFFSFADIYAADNNFVGSFALIYGQKEYDKEDWEPVEKQTLIGYKSDFGAPTWNTLVAIDFFRSSDKSDYGTINADMIVYELDLGPRFYNNLSPNVLLYFGGGMNITRVKLSARNLQFPYNSLTWDDNNVGWWANTGIQYVFTNQFFVGFDTRYSSAKMKFSGTNGTLKTDGIAYNLAAGFRWGYQAK